MIYDQPKLVDDSINSFLVSLAEAVAIVIVVLLITMGLRSGILMSLVLLLTICGTFIVMKITAIDLHRVSLGHSSLRLGMLVDNAIVITDGILIGLKQGLTRVQAAHRIISQTVWPLFGATVIAVVAFAPIGLSPDATGEFTGSLFWIMLISLMIFVDPRHNASRLSSPRSCFPSRRFKKEDGGENEAIDPYKGVFYHL